MKDKKGLTPIHLALLNIGNYGSEIRKILTINEETVNAPINETGNTLLHCAIANKVENDKKTAHVQILLENGANPNVTNKIGHSSVHLAALNDSPIAPTLLQLLLAKGGNANLPDKANAGTPIHYAAFNRADCATELISILVEHGGNPNAIGAIRRTPLHVALKNQDDQVRLKIVTELLIRGGSPNAKDANGETPVHCAVLENRKNSLEVIKLLLEYGGDVNASNNNNITPFNLVSKPGYRSYCSPEVKRCIQKASRKKINPPKK